MVTVDRGPISAQDTPGDIPEDKWDILVGARRSFARTNIPYDCRELLRFVTEGREFRMIEKLGYANEDDFIRRGLGLDPTTVDYALITLRLIKPQWAMPFDTAAKIGIALAKHGRAEDAPRDEKGRYQKSKAGNASLGGYNTAPHIRARLERDGKTELLAQVERGEISAHAAAKEAGYRKQAVCHLPTVPGFLKAAQAHLSPEQRLELKEAL